MTRVEYNEYNAELINKMLNSSHYRHIFFLNFAFYVVNVFTPIEMGINVYPNKFGDINSLNVHAIYTDHMIVFTLFVTKTHKICFGNI